MTSLITDYATVDQLKAHLRRPLANTDDDAWFQIVLTAASRAIDAECGRRFGQAPSATVRLFTYRGETIDDQQAVPLDDVSVTTDFAVDGYTLDTDVVLWPYTAGDVGEPYTHLILTTTGCFSTDYRDVTVTARWGWAAVPSLVEVACLIQAARWFMRRDSWAGVTGSPELGTETRLLSKLDADVAVALGPVTRFWGAV